MEARGMDTRIQEWGQARSQELQTYHGVTGLWQYLRTTSDQTDIWIYRPNIESCPDSLQKEQWIWEYNLKACRELVEACRKKDLDWKKVVGVLSSDMSKAFDSLWSPLLTEQVDACQFSKKALNLVRSYFSQRKNGVRLSKVWCQKRLSLGIYIWTLIVECFSEWSSLRWRPSDSSDNSIAKVEEGPLHNGNKMTSWYEEKINIKKYQSMVLGKRISTDAMDLRIGGVQIEQSHNMKLLRIIIIIGRLQSRRLRASSSHNDPVPIQTACPGQSCCLCLIKGVECTWETGFVAFLVFSSHVVEYTVRIPCMAHHQASWVHGPETSVGGFWHFLLAGQSELDHRF